MAIVQLRVVCLATWLALFTRMEDALSRRMDGAGALRTSDTPVGWRTNKRSGVNRLRPVTRGAVTHSGLIDRRAHYKVLNSLRPDTPR